MLTIILLIIAGLANSVMDITEQKYDKSIFAKLPESWQWWLDPRISWLNKHERFKWLPFRKSLFVFVTDLWHFAQFIMGTALIFAIPYDVPAFELPFDLDLPLQLVVWAILYKTIYTTSFVVGYNFLFRIKQQNNETIKELF